jgi:osmoprotectant transport system substrate-binding protein
MTPFSDSNALAVTPETAERYGLRSIGDLAKIPGGAQIAAPPEFRTRFEGLVGLNRSASSTRRSTATPSTPLRSSPPTGCSATTST